MRSAASICLEMYAKTGALAGVYGIVDAEVSVLRLVHRHETRTALLKMLSPK
jgi:hypothetical protein